MFRCKYQCNIIVYFPFKLYLIKDFIFCHINWFSSLTKVTTSNAKYFSFLPQVGTLQVFSDTGPALVHTLILRSVCTLSISYIWTSFGVSFYGKKLHLFSVINLYKSLLHIWQHITSIYLKLIQLHDIIKCHSYPSYELSYNSFTFTYLYISVHIFTFILIHFKWTYKKNDFLSA